jgi:hypothetical protein
VCIDFRRTRWKKIGRRCWNIVSRDKYGTIVRVIFAVTKSLPIKVALRLWITSKYVQHNLKLHAYYEWHIIELNFASTLQYHSCQYLLKIVVYTSFQKLF